MIPCYFCQKTNNIPIVSIIDNNQKKGKICHVCYNQMKYFDGVWFGERKYVIFQDPFRGNLWIGIEEETE